MRSYRTVSPLPDVPEGSAGGLFSVALSLGSPPPDVIRHRVSLEPGLSSTPELAHGSSGRPAGWHAPRRRGAPSGQTVTPRSPCSGRPCRRARNAAPVHHSLKPAWPSSRCLESATVAGALGIRGFQTRSDEMRTMRAGVAPMAAAIVMGLGLAGCGYTPEQRATSGGLIGAGTGAAIASAAGGGPGAVIAGALLGGGTGALVGANTAPPPPALRLCPATASATWPLRGVRRGSVRTHLLPGPLRLLSATAGWSPACCRRRTSAAGEAARSIR